jgi:putative hydrolase of the HAD superfamily
MALVKAYDSAYDGFIFDYGGVLVGHQTPAEVEQMAATAGIPQERFFTHYWDTRLAYDKGSVTADEYWQNIARANGKHFSSATIAELIDIDSRSWMHFDEVMWEWIEQLRAAGKRLAILSNMPRELGEALKSQTGRFHGFDHVTLSYELHSVKPERVIYEECLAGIGTQPARTVFFDDRIANVEGAELAGIHAVEFLNRDDVLRRMRG